MTPGTSNPYHKQCHHSHRDLSISLPSQAYNNYRHYHHNHHHDDLPLFFFSDGALFVCSSKS
jgi:hypothetical protein